MERLSFYQQICNRIYNYQEGSVFIIADFLDIANQATIRQTLNRLVAYKQIARVMRGVYHKPKYNSFLGEFVAPHPDAVAHAIARNFGWTIVPCGETALNLLGLSTQVPSVWSYVSDGLYREYGYKKVQIIFKKTMNRQITVVSYKTALVIQAIRALGIDNITQLDIDKISFKLNYDEKQRMLIEAKFVPSWIYEIIREICWR